jgi:hypothetical protein
MPTITDEEIFEKVSNLLPLTYSTVVDLLKNNKASAAVTFMRWNATDHVETLDEATYLVKLIQKFEGME